MKKWSLVIFLSVICLCGCMIQNEEETKLRDVEFTVMDEREIPQELKDNIEEQKEDVFGITYGDDGYLYIAKGYGAKETSGYSVEVVQCFETEHTICLETNLIGPPKEEEVAETETYPYIVIKTEYSDKFVEFE